MAFNIHDYHLDVVNHRLILLHLVLQYDSEKNEGDFNVYDRIMINQQRGDLLVFIRSLFRQANHEDVRYYLLSDILDDKIDLVLNKIKKQNWKPNPIDYDNY